MGKTRLSLIVVAVLLLITARPVQGGIRADLSGDAVVDFQTSMDMPFVTVRNVTNAGEISGMGAGGYGPDRICGAVDYVYNIGKFEVTAGQYTEFLNAVAATDTHGLYNPYMWEPDPTWGDYSCKIERSGSSGSYTYAVAADWEDRPVNYVSWGDSARFANWLTNGRPTGAQDLRTTEDGSYFLNSATSIADLLTVTRELDAQYVVPTEDEWYKAAYHKNDGDTGNYFDYPTSSIVLPSNDLIDSDPGNNANFPNSGSTIGSPYWRTEAGEFENSESPYGTFDMAGNIWEWNEAIISRISGTYRGGRGGSFYGSSDFGLQAWDRTFDTPTLERSYTGFRLAELPEPATLALMAIAGVGLLAKSKGRKFHWQFHRRRETGRSSPF